MSKTDTKPEALQPKPMQAGDAGMPPQALQRCSAPACDDIRLLALLREDVPFGDLTTDALGLSSHEARAAQARFSARRPMTASGIEEAARLFELCGASAQVHRDSGSSVAAGELLLSAQGTAAALLKAWKTAQTLAEWMSGIASAARQIVDALQGAGFDTPLACTRKNFPGTRAFAAKAVRSGGAVMHRLGLSETLLVFPEHRGFIASDELAARLAQVRRCQPEKRLVAEVVSEADALALARAGADVLQLERFAPAQLTALRATLATAGLHPLLAPAGGVTLANALDFARAGADFLVSSAPYFAPPADIAVAIEPSVRGS